jgi:hypothetical protein
VIAATVALLVLLALASGLVVVLRSGDQAGTGAQTSGPTGALGPTTTPRGERAAPWPQRPVVRLRLEVAADRSRVDGRETIRFRPDLRVCALVFRAWPNKPETAHAGNALVVTAVWVAGRPVRSRVSGAGAPPGSPGTLIEVPLPRCVPAGAAIDAELRFRLALGANTRERVGYSVAPGINSRDSRDSRVGMAWFGTGFPLLAWERGRGWATDPAVDLYGEMATSEEFRLASLDVVARAGEEVLGTGELVERVPGPGGTTVSRFRADSVRDIAVTVGELRLVERSANGVRLHVGGLATGTAVPLERWADRTAEAMRKLTALLGPCPYTDLWVTVVPPVPTGIEFPGAIQFADVDPATFGALVSHEVAHMWFYGLVGNSQAQHPWLDESFATWAQAVVDGDEGSYQLASVPADLVGLVGQPMTFWARRGDDYGPGVYLQGGAALIEARRAAGPARFDQAVRSYLDVNAHQIATPDDVERAFAGLPEALKILRRVGALP